MAKKKSAVKTAKASKPAKKAVKKKAAGEKPVKPVKNDPKAAHKLKAIGNGLTISIAGPSLSGKSVVGSMVTELLQQLGYDVMTQEENGKADIIHRTTPMVSIAALGNWDKSRNLPAFVQTMQLGDTK